MKKHSDEIPVISEERIRSAPTIAKRHLGKKSIKKVYDIRLRVDGDVYRWLRKSGPEHPSRVNKILRDIMELSNV